MRFKMIVRSYIKTLFFLWIALTGVQPLFASEETLPAQEGLNYSNSKLDTLFKLSGLEDFLENIESVVEMSVNIPELLTKLVNGEALEVLAPWQEEFARRIMGQAYSTQSFYHTLRQSFIEDYKPQHVHLAVQWYQSALGKKILRLQSEANDLTNGLALESLGEKLLESPPSQARERLLERVGTSIVPQARTLFLAYVELVHHFSKKVDAKEFRKILDDKKGLRKKLETLKENTARPIQDVVSARLYFSYINMKDKDLEKYADFLDSPAGQWFSYAQLRGFNKGIEKAYNKANLIKAELLKEIYSGGPKYPLLRNLVSPGQRYLLIGRRDPFRPLVSKQKLVSSSGKKKKLVSSSGKRKKLVSSSEKKKKLVGSSEKKKKLVGSPRREPRRPDARLFGDELRDTPPLALLIFEEIKNQHPKLYGELKNLERLFNDRKALENMGDKEYAKAIENYRDALERSAAVILEVTPLQIEYDALKMTGIIQIKKEALAMFEIDTKGYSVKKGDLLGPSFGAVEEVKNGQVIVIEKFRDYLGNILKNKEVIKINRDYLTRVDKNL
jgi:Tfp pilus assembly protein PilP